MIQECQAWLPGLPRQSLRVALGASRAEAELHGGPRKLGEGRWQGHSDTWGRVAGYPPVLQNAWNWDRKGGSQTAGVISTCQELRVVSTFSLLSLRCLQCSIENSLVSVTNGFSFQQLSLSPPLTYPSSNI